MSDMRSWLNLSETLLSAADAKEVVKAASDKQGIFKNVFNKAKSPDEFMRLWQRSGYPLHVDDLIEFLKDMGISPRVTKKLFQKMHIDTELGSDEKVTKLAKAIAAASLVPQVMTYLNKVAKLKEGQWDEYKLTDKQIRSIFIELSKINKKDSTSVRNFIQQWIDDFNAAVDDAERAQLVGEISGYLLDIQDSPEEGQYRPVVIDSVRKSDMDDTALRDRMIQALKQRVQFSDFSPMTPEEDSNVQTINSWISKFEGAISPLSQYSLVAAIVNFLSKMPDNKTYRNLRKQAIDAISNSTISDSRKVSILNDIRSRRPYTKSSSKPATTDAPKNKISAQYGSVKEDVIDEDRLLISIFESAIILKNYSRVKKWPVSRD